MRHTLSVIFILAAIWLLNSGHYTPLILTFGLLSVLFVTRIAHLMDVVDHESQPVHLTRRIIPYYFWLLKQIVIANFDVVKRIWRGNGSISPTLALINASQKTDMGRVIYANSITLTPGTVTVELEPGRLLIHSLTAAGVQDLQQGDMDRRVTGLED